METFDDRDFYTPASSNGSKPPIIANAASVAVNSITAIEQSRAVAEVQAALVIAKSQPRDELRAEYKIKEACKRMGLAETAIYSYKRGGGQVEGPSIRLAETMARYWGNLQYGFRELSRESGASEVESFCWDLETNTKATRVFQVKHWRDTKGGGYAIKDERDKYELIANQAQRRVRSCILEVIPGDIVEAATVQCNLTMTGDSDLPLKDRLKKMVAAYETLGVTAIMLSAKLQHSLDSVTIYEFRQLGKFYTAIKDGYSTVEELFGTDPLKSYEQIEAEKAKTKLEPAAATQPSEQKPKTKAKAKLAVAPEPPESAPPDDQEEPYTPVPSTVPCPNRNDQPVDDMDCASCRQREGCPSWESEAI